MKTVLKFALPVFCYLTLATSKGFGASDPESWRTDPQKIKEGNACAYLAKWFIRNRIRSTSVVLPADMTANAALCNNYRTACMNAKSAIEDQMDGLMERIPGAPLNQDEIAHWLFTWLPCGATKFEDINGI